MAALGIDFGTSNCSAHVADTNGVVAVQLDGDDYSLPSVVFTARREVALREVENNEFEKRLRGARAEQSKNRSDTGSSMDDAQLEKAITDAMRREATSEANRAYWDQTFFSMLKGGDAILFGTPALRAYFSDPLSGILVKSPKSFLGSDIKTQYLARFEDIVAAMLQHIKSKAETASNSEIASVVLGRPVRYHGTQGEKGNEQALELMTSAALRSGFSDVRFELEPLAAAYEYERSISGEEKILVIDVGGGTTDCVMLRASPTRARNPDRRGDILGVSGDRVGGTDFDESLVWNGFMPAFGKDSMTRSGYPVPYPILHDAISIRDVHAQLRFARSGEEIRQLERECLSPEKIARFRSLKENQLQYRLVHSAEQAKIALSEQNACDVPLHYIEDHLSIPIDRDLLSAAGSRFIEKIRMLATDAIASAGTRPDVVFMTGGMAIAPIVSEAIAAIAGKDIPIKSSDMLGTVGKGLGLCAQRMFNGTHP